MGNSKYLDSLSIEEKSALSNKLWNIQNHKSFICGCEIDLDVQKTNIPYVTDNDLLVKYKDSFLQDGDIIISDTAEDSTVGKCTEIQNHQEIIILSGLHTIPVRPQRTFAKGYLGYFLNFAIVEIRTNLN